MKPFATPSLEDYIPHGWGLKWLHPTVKLAKTHWHPTDIILDPEELSKRTFERRLMRFNFTIIQSSMRNLKPNETFCHPKSWRPYPPWLGSRMVTSHSEIGKNPLTPNRHHLRPRRTFETNFWKKIDEVQLHYILIFSEKFKTKWNLLPPQVLKTISPMTGGLKCLHPTVKLAKTHWHLTNII